MAEGNRATGGNKIAFEKEKVNCALIIKRARRAYLRSLLFSKRNEQQEDSKKLLMKGLIFNSVKSLLVQWKMNFKCWKS